MIDLNQMQMRAPSVKWVSDRASYLGGTDIAAIMELHPYKTAMGVYNDKKGLVAPVELNQAMVHGQNLELYVAQIYSRVTGRKLHKSHFYRDKQLPHLACNPDYEVRGERPLRLVECKTAGYFAGQIFGEEGDAVPDQYLVQCMWQLMITGRQVCDLAVLIGGQDFRVYTIERDEELIATLRSRADEWWQTYIVAECPPPLTGHKADSEFIKDQYPNSTYEELHAPPGLDDMCIALAEVRESVKALATEEARLTNIIKDYMGDAGTLKCSAGDITWKSSEKTGRRTFLVKFKEVSKCQTAA